MNSNDNSLIFNANFCEQIRSQTILWFARKFRITNSELDNFMLSINWQSPNGNRIEIIQPKMSAIGLIKCGWKRRANIKV